VQGQYAQGYQVPDITQTSGFRHFNMYTSKIPSSLQLRNIQGTYSSKFIAFHDIRKKYIFSTSQDALGSGSSRDLQPVVRQLREQLLQSVSHGTETTSIVTRCKPTLTQEHSGGVGEHLISSALAYGGRRYWIHLAGDWISSQVVQHQDSPLEALDLAVW
jgi:hypothetical protein